MIFVNPDFAVPMRRWRALSTIMIVAFGGDSLLVAETDKEPLTIPTVSGWRVEHKGSGFYSVRKTGDEPGELLIMPALPLSRDELRGRVDEMAKKFVERSKESQNTKLDRDDYTLLEIRGEQFSGFYTVFTMRGVQLNATFAISSADETWWGQYSGVPSHWPDALAIIKGLKKKAL